MNKKEQIFAYMDTIGEDPTTQDLMERFGVKDRHARTVRAEYKLRKAVDGIEIKKKPDDFSKFEDNGETANLDCSFIAPDMDEKEALKKAVKEYNVDDAIWKAVRYSIIKNKWGMSFKQHEVVEHQKTEAGQVKIIRHWEPGTVTNYQYKVKVYFERKTLERIIELVTEASIEQMKQHSPIYPVVKYKKRGKIKNASVVSLTDMHIGKLALEEECGESYNIKEAVNLRNWTIDEAISYFKPTTTEIIYIIGNDDAHYDGKNKSTTRGTLVDTDGQYWQVFEAVKKSHIRAIDKFREIAPVRVISVQGNHDEHLAYFMGSTIDAQYHAVKEVNVDYSPKPQKYITYGSTMFMITHGREERRVNLPLIMATDEAEMWGRAKNREILTGDLHHKKDVNYIGTEDMQGIIVRILPSMGGLDRWHKGKGYRSVRAADIFHYDHEYGFIGTDFIPYQRYAATIK